MNEQAIDHQIVNGVANIILNRPGAHNALNADMLHALLNVLSDLTRNESVRVIILSGNGENFCPGADLNWMKETTKDQSDSAISQQLATLMYRLNSVSKPTIAVVKGAVYGGGIGLVACCDIVLAAKDTHFCFSEVRLGLIPAVISPYVIRLIGTRAARRYLLTSELIRAEQALAIGLVNEVLDENELQTFTSNLTKKLIRAGPKALSLTKKLITNVSQTQLDKSLIENTVAWLDEIRATDEAIEGVNAFFEKREANWVCHKK